MKFYSLALVGSGGAGVVTLGQLLLELAAQKGYYGLLRKSFGAQIRGGESAALLRLSTHPVNSMGDKFDAVLALDWKNVERFKDEIVLHSQAEIMADERAGKGPEIGTKLVKNLPLEALAKKSGGRANMVALGFFVNKLCLDPETGRKLIEKKFTDKGHAVLTSSLKAYDCGLEIDSCPINLAGSRKKSAWLLTGNQAAAFGALKGGIRFVGAYPITPASDLLEWIAPRIELVGGTLLQAEDELASINSVIGASWGGVPSMTATSGPGLSLMSEGLGLAVASETPLVVVNVQRGGPSTGIPTKSSQADLSIAIHGCHGDAPHLVLAPVDVADCLTTTQWVVGLAEALQCPAIVLLDQFLGQTETVIDEPLRSVPKLKRKLDVGSDVDYLRYAITEDGVSAFAAPGCEGIAYTADGLEHDPSGKPSGQASDHHIQMSKRLRKLTEFDYGDFWGEIIGEKNDVDVTLITWGSSFHPCIEAKDRLTEQDVKVRVIAIRLLSPIPIDAIKNSLQGCGRCLVVEQNASGQLFNELRAAGLFDQSVQSLALQGPVPIKPGVIVEALL